MTVCSETPPAGWSFIAKDEYHSYAGHGVVLSVLGGGAIFCEFNYYGSASHRVVSPSEAAHWRFFETHDEFSAAFNRIAA